MFQRAIATVQACTIESVFQCSVELCFRVGTTSNGDFIIDDAVFRNAINFAEVSVYFDILLGDIDDSAMDKDGSGEIGSLAAWAVMFGDQRRFRQCTVEDVCIRNEDLVLRDR